MFLSGLFLKIFNIKFNFKIIFLIFFFIFFIVLDNFYPAHLDLDYLFLTIHLYFIFFSHASSMGICRDRVRRYSRSPHNVTTSTQPKSPPPEGTSQPTSSNSNSYFQQHHPERKSGSMQREELLQIIQANMDKNNLTFQTSR